jgi:hypothetical protein
MGDMGERGRKSTASLSVIGGGAVGRRPDPPEDLTELEAAVWVTTVVHEPADFFGTSALQQLLKDYCRHVVAAERLSTVIEKHMSVEDSDVSLRDLDLYLRMRDRETRAVADSATKLRLTNQSRYTPKAAGTAGRHNSKSKPWHG